MEEREQKTVTQATDRPKGDKLEAEGLSGVQTCTFLNSSCLPITSAERLGR